MIKEMTIKPHAIRPVSKPSLGTLSKCAVLCVCFAIGSSGLQAQTRDESPLPGLPLSPNASGVRSNELYIASPTPHTNYSLDEAITIEATSLARGVTDLLYMRQHVGYAREGATVYLWLTDSKQMVDIKNANEVAEKIDQRLAQYRKAIEKRGASKLGKVYDMVFNDQVLPTLVDERSGELWWWDSMSYQPIVVVENKFAIKHYGNTEITLIGEIVAGDTLPIEIWVTESNMSNFDKIQPSTLSGKATWRTRNGKQARYADAYSSRAGYFLDSNMFEWAFEDANSALEIAPNHDAALGVRSQIYSASPIDNLRDGKKALADAEKYCELSQDSEIKWKCGVVRGSAFAELGRFDAAIAEVEHALRYAPDEVKPLLQKHLDSYKSKKPNRMKE